MTKKVTRVDKTVDLHKQAVDALQAKNEEYEALNEELRSTIEQLQAATEELQAQNEELQQQAVALRESEEKYRLLFNSGGDAIFLHDKEGQILAVNQQACEQFGYTHAELISMKINQMDSPAEVQHIPERIARLMEQGHLTFETVHQRKDGSLIPHEVNTRRIIWNGHPAIMSICRDITERKRMGEALLNSEAQKNAILNGITTNIALVDKELKIMWANKAAVSSVNKQVGNIVGHPCYSFWGDKVAPCANCPTLKSFKTGKSEHIIVETPDGRIWDERGEPILDAAGNVTAVVEIAQDITDRKKAEEALRESEDFLRTILDTTADGFWLIDSEEGVITDVNEAYCSLSGYTREEILGLHINDIDADETPAQTQERIHRIISTNSELFETCHRRKDGSIFPVEIAIAYINKGGGKFVCFARDLTDRKRAEEAQRESLQRLEFALQGGKLGMWDWNPQNGAVVYNDLWAQMLEYRPDEVEPTVEFFKQHVHPEDLAVVLDRLTGHVEGRLPVYDSEHRFRTKSGRWLWVLDRGKIAERDKDGRPVRVTGIIADVTDRRRAEEEKQALQERLTRSEKMESLGLLAGGVAHDLNNVLGIVVGYAEMVLGDIDEKSPLRDDLLTIMDGGQKAAAIVQDMLTLTRRGVSGRKVLNLNKLIGDFKKSPEWQKLLDYHPTVQINIDLEPDLLNISGSAVHLEKTLFNLVSNAGESMTQGGLLTITSTNQYLDKPISGYDNIREGDYVVLSVSDKGDGISATDIKRIFEPFYTKKIMGRSGTGLGLSVVWGTVKDHNGYIDVQSEEGKGTIFTLYFPVSREDIATEPSAVSMSEYLGNGESILVVDDVKKQRDLAARMLQSLKYNVSSVSSGEDAIEYLKDHKVDLIVLDMIMDPGMDGLDTYKSILEIHPQQKAIIVSGFSESDRVNAAHDLGAGAYVKKPYVIEKLGLAVKKELDRAT